jgi:ornithine cyclodeaminase/alanine dehydrogenase-like protein (mu-crystallin family)
MQNNRRGFLSTCAAATTVVPYFHSLRRTLADETRAKNDRFALGIIGAGGIANYNIEAARQWVDVVAIADVDSGHAARFKEMHAGGRAAVYDDYRRILERKDVDVIHIATPDHWHTKPVVEAMLAGKDIYCEKPLTLTIDEGKLIRNVQRKTGRVVKDRSANGTSASVGRAGRIMRSNRRS